MKKSPLSAPGGSGSPRFRWNNRDCYSGTGYVPVKTDNYQSFVPGQDQASPQKGGDDFIPLGFSSPVSQQQRDNGYRRGPGGGRNQRNSVGGGFNLNRNSYQNNYQGSPKSSHNSPNSPYNFHPHQRNFQRKSFQKDWHRQVDIRSYVNLQAILEDPWADLMRNLDKAASPQSCRNENSVNESSSSCGSILLGDLTVKSNSSSLETDKTQSEVIAK